MRLTPFRVAGRSNCFDAFACIAHRKTERVGIDRLEGRVSTTLLTPYPPGIRC